VAGVGHDRSTGGTKTNSRTLPGGSACGGGGAAGAGGSRGRPHGVEEGMRSFRDRLDEPRKGFKNRVWAELGGKPPSPRSCECVCGSRSVGAQEPRTCRREGGSGEGGGRRGEVGWVAGGEVDGFDGGPTRTIRRGGRRGAKRGTEKLSQFSRRSTGGTPPHRVAAPGDLNAGSTAHRGPGPMSKGTLPRRMRDARYKVV